ncbi:hypothetical protein [Streptomyces sp. NBC_01361]|uniref:hypothetical protein n=1 Tax=Streptomyces sp. NBC_01361 TaxID=2903838 RepID=UPI002E332E35|nr:hypothetical protein [Streptomyces sp. NBC_01361]
MADSVEPIAPFELRQVMDEIVSAVRDGDDALLGSLLERFAGLADARAVFMLRLRLHQDLEK